MNKRGGAIAFSVVGLMMSLLVVSLSPAATVAAAALIADAIKWIDDECTDDSATECASVLAGENECNNTDDGLAGNRKSTPCSSSIKRSLNLLTVGISGSDNSSFCLLLL